MSEYTPTTDEVRAVWREWNGYGGLIDRTCPEPTTRAGMVAEFDRWLDQVKAEAFDEGWKDRAARDPLVMNIRGHSAPPPPHGLNPYRQEGDQ